MKLFLSLACLALACSASAQDATPAWRVDETAVLAKFTKLPPASASEEEREDLDELLLLQGSLASVKADGSSPVRPINDCTDANKQRVPGMKWFFGPKSGIKAAAVLSEKQLSLVEKFGEELIEETGRVSGFLKEQHHRVRPYNAHPELIKSCAKPLPEAPDETTKKAGKSFPSSHAAMGRLMGEVFAEIFPAKADVLRAQGARIGYLRKRVGVHYPSDVAAGIGLADLMRCHLNEQAAFREQVEELKKAAKLLK